MAFDAEAIADACNADFHFQEAGWEESEESISRLLAMPSFQERLTRIPGYPIQPSLAALVAAVYEHRLAERGAPWQERGRQGPRRPEER